MNDEKPETPAIAFIREIVRRAILSVHYHEEALIKAYADLDFARDMMRRCDFDIDDTEYDSDDNDDIVFESVTQFTGSILMRCREAVEHHEMSLKDDHAKLAMVKIMLARGRYAEIDITEMEAQLSVKGWAR